MIELFAQDVIRSGENHNPITKPKPNTFDYLPSPNHLIWFGFEFSHGLRVLCPPLDILIAFVSRTCKHLSTGAAAAAEKSKIHIVDQEDTMRLFIRRSNVIKKRPNLMEFSEWWNSVENIGNGLLFFQSKWQQRNPLNANLSEDKF